MNIYIAALRRLAFIWLILTSVLIASCAQTRHELNTKAAISAKFENLNVHRLVWSPDGKKIAFVQGSSGGEPVGYGNLVLLDISNGATNKLGNEKWGYASVVRWSPAGDQIVVTGEGGLWLVSVVDGSARYLTRGEGAA